MASIVKHNRQHTHPLRSHTSRKTKPLIEQPKYNIRVELGRQSWHIAAPAQLLQHHLHQAVKGNAHTAHAHALLPLLRVPE